jgi:phosphonopyruvate decarboxylase
MGHASQIALGIALQRKERHVYCFDGDGAVLMHMGSLAINGSIKPDNFIHIVFNNGSHDSVGGQPTMGLKIDLPKIALSCGYARSFSISDKESLKKIFEEVKKTNAPVFIEIKVKKGARKDLGRPDTKPVQNKTLLMEFLNK